MNVHIELKMNVYADDMYAATKFTAKLHDQAKQLYLTTQDIGRNIAEEPLTMEVSFT